MNARARAQHRTVSKISVYLVAGLFVLIPLMALCLVGYSIVAVNTNNTVTITVAEKEVKRTGETDVYMVWSDEGEVFENRDSLLKGKFDSSDLQGQLTVGETYECDVTGFRIQFLSKYRNLIECEAATGS